MPEHTPVEHPFLERSGVGSEASVQRLLNLPEAPLDSAEQKQVQQFATGLLSGEYGDLKVESALSLEELNAISTTADQHEFSVGYFDLGSEMAIRDREMLGLSADEDQAEIITALNDVDAILGKVDKPSLKKIAARSAKWEKSYIINLLEKNPDDDSEFDELSSTSVNYNPAKLLDKFDHLMRYRRFYKEVDTRLKDSDPSTLIDAQKAVVGLHQGKVRELIAGLYPSVIAIARQVEAYPDVEANQQVVGLLENAAPVVAAVQHKKEGSEPVEGFLRRLDYVRNGAAINNQTLSPIAEEIDKLAANLDKKSDESLEAELPAEFIKRLEKISWDAPTMNMFLTTVLAEMNVLSAHEATWDEVDERNGSAADEKFQVVTRPGSSGTLAVDSSKLVIYVPETFKRNLIDKYPAGVLPVAAHEVTHALQALVDRDFARTIPLAKIRGRRYITVREGGGISQEQVFHRRFLGQDRRPNPYYYLALGKKLDGANRLQATRAFYDAMIEDEDLSGLNEQELSRKSDALRSKAVDSVARLYNRYEGHNSQPLNYIEQDLIASQLSQLSEKQRNQFLLRLGSFNVEDAAKLHTYNLYPTHTPFDEVDIPRTVMEVYLRDFNEV